jgi:hypothetical protein
MNTLQRRVTRLERAHAPTRGPAFCQCIGQRQDIRIYPGPDAKAQAEADTRPAHICAECQRLRLIIDVLYGDK